MTKFCAPMRSLRANSTSRSTLPYCSGWRSGSEPIAWRRRSLGETPWPSSMFAHRPDIQIRQLGGARQLDCIEHGRGNVIRLQEVVRHVGFTLAQMNVLLHLSGGAPGKHAQHANVIGVDIGP